MFLIIVIFIGQTLKEILANIFFQQGLTLLTNPFTNPFNNMASCNPIWVCPNNSGCQTQSETSLFYTGNASGDFKAEEVEVFQIINSINN